jgi:hypothetical protein
VPAEIPVAIRELAETPDRYSRLTPGFVERVDTGRYVVLRAPAWAAVSGVRVDTAAVRSTVQGVRELVGERFAVWWLGPTTEPPDLDERLRTLGFGLPHDRVAELHSMATVEPPEAVEADVRLVESSEDYATAAELRWRAFDTPPERQDRAGLEQAYVTQLGADSVLTFLAYADRRPAATGACVVSERGLLLFGGATADWARGRGLYRALVRARWEEAVRRGTPALVVQADPSTSAPILRRLGFVEVCRQRRLEDHG